MSSLSSPGIGSGLDIQGIVSQLVKLEQRPITQIQQRSAGLQTKLSAFGQLQSQLSNLQDQLGKVMSSSTWTTMRLNSSNAAALTGTVSANALPASFTVDVINLARAQSAGSSPVATSTPVGAGNLIIEIGSWSGTNFTARRTSPSIEVSASDTLVDVASKINSASAGVSAVVINEGTNQRLLVRSTETGEPNGFRIRAQDNAGNLLSSGSGLDRLAFYYSTASSGFVGMSRGPDQEARNTSATINGLAVSSASNTLTNVVDGVTLTLNQVTTSSVNVSVARDDSQAQGAINAFVQSYNALNSALSEMTRFDPARKTAGTLQGDSTAVGLQQALRRLVTGNGPSGLAFRNLSDIGVELQKDGSLRVNEGRLTDALDNRSDIQSLFNTSSTGPGSGGIGAQLNQFISGMLGSTGVLGSRAGSIQNSLARNEREVERLNEKVSRTEERLLAQYSRLDANLAKLNALNTYVNQQLTALSARNANQ